MNEHDRRLTIHVTENDQGRSSTPGRLRLAACLLPLILVMATATGCAPRSSVPGSIRAESLGEPPAVLTADYVSTVYYHDPNGETAFLLTDVPVQELLAGNVRHAQVMHLQLLWRPKAGSTPMDPTATNATIRHVIVVDGEVGIYGGAGFALPSGKPGHGRMKIVLRDATVRLLESTDGFNDPLTPARITGNFTAENDPQLARKVHHAISQIVTTAIGRTRFVGTGGPASVTAAALSTSPEAARACRRQRARSPAKRRSARAHHGPGTDMDGPGTDMANDRASDFSS